MIAPDVPPLSGGPPAGPPVSESEPPTEQDAVESKASAESGKLKAAEADEARPQESDAEASKAAPSQSESTGGGLFPDLAPRAAAAEPGQLRALLSSGVIKKSRPPPPPPPSASRSSDASAARSATLVASAASSSTAPPPPVLKVERKTPPPPPRPSNSMEQTLTGLGQPTPSSPEQSDAAVDGIDLNWDDSDDDAPPEKSSPSAELKDAGKDTEPDLSPSGSQQRALPLPPPVTTDLPLPPPPIVSGAFLPAADDDDDDDEDALTHALPSPDPLEAATVPLPSVRESRPPSRAGISSRPPRPISSSRLPALPALPALVPPSRRSVDAPPASRSVTGPLPPPSLPSSGPLPSFSAPSAPSNVAPASLEPFAVPARGQLLESLLRGPKRTFMLAALGTVLALVVIISILIAIPTGKQGTLIITVSGPGNSLVRTLSVNLDDAARCSSSPCRIEKLPTGTHFVQVNSPNHEPMATRAVQIEPGGETVLHVELMPVRAPVAESSTTKASTTPAVDFDADAPAEHARGASRHVAAAAPAAAPAAERRAVAPAKSVLGKLSVNSIPPSSVVIDGQPLGRTPQTKSVAAGSHSVVFIHPTLGRRVQSAQVSAGATKSVVARFK